MPWMTVNDESGESAAPVSRSSWTRILMMYAIASPRTVV